jgi:hypothetical protein
MTYTQLEPAPWPGAGEKYIWPIPDYSPVQALSRLMNLIKDIAGTVSFTRLYVKIRQEDGAFTILVRLQNHLKTEEAAWGQETAATIEIASSMIGALAEQYSIPQQCISIDIGMENFRDGTLH